MSDQLWYIEFGFKPGRNPMSVGPFPSAEDARREVSRAERDNPSVLSSGYRITGKPRLSKDYYPHPLTPGQVSLLARTEAGRPLETTQRRACENPEALEVPVIQEAYEGTMGRPETLRFLVEAELLEKYYESGEKYYVFRKYRITEAGKQALQRYRQERNRELVAALSDETEQLDGSG